MVPATQSMLQTNLPNKEAQKQRSHFTVSLELSSDEPILLLCNTNIYSRIAFLFTLLIAGWLADVCFGRYNMMYRSM